MSVRSLAARFESTRMNLPSDNNSTIEEESANNANNSAVEMQNENEMENQRMTLRHLKEFPINFYKKGRKLGKGSYGSVKQYDKIDGAPPKLPVHVAVKKIDGSLENDAEAMGEISILQRARHPNIVKFHGYCKISEDQTGIVMELCHGTLKNLIKGRKLTVLEVIYLLRKVLSGLRHLHNNLGIIHRDIKPENVLLQAIDNGVLDWKTVHVTKLRLKLSDFGLSHALTQSKVSHTVSLTPRGTFQYMSPEVKRAFLDSERAPFSKHADIWACGILAFYLLTGETDGISRITTDNKFKEEKIDKFLLSMLKENKRDRPSVDELLSHNMLRIITEIYELIPKSLREEDYVNLAKYLKIYDGEEMHDEIRACVVMLAESGQWQKLTSMSSEGIDVVNTYDNFGATIHYASVKGHIETVKALCQCGADVNSKGANDMTALHIACWRGYLALVQFLVSEAKSDVKAKDCINDTPLHYACRFGHLDIVKYLIKHWATDTNSANNYSYTPLHYATESWNLSVIKCLIREGKADVNAKTNNDDTPLDLCKTMASQEAMSHKGQMPIILYLMRKTQVSEKSKNKITLLLLCFYAYQGNLKKVKKMTSELDDKVITDDDDAPLHNACKAGHLNIVEYLIEKGKFKMDKKYADERTPLHLASMKGHLSIVKCLTEKGKADLNAKDGSSNTALHLAASNGHMDVFRYLAEESGADVTAKNYYNETPLDQLQA